MPNLLDHVREAGARSLDERPFDALDALAASQLVYMPLEGFWQEDTRCTLREASELLVAGVDPDGLDVFQKKRYELFVECGSQPRYADWQVSGYINDVDIQREMQFCACCYDLPDGQRCVAFRGTDITVAGWKEDLNLALMTVPSQKAAAAYTERAAVNALGGLCLTGHSKGGNLAVYAASNASLEAQKRIRRVYSFDGPGLDEQTTESEGYRRVAARVESLIPQGSVVGLLLSHHPAYTVVRSTALGLLQHDAMTWQIRDGDFVRLEEVDLSARVAEEAIHSWLSRMNRQERGRLVAAIDQMLSATRTDLVTDMLSDWKQSARRMRQAFRDLPDWEKRFVLSQLKALLSAGADEWLRALMQTLSSNAGERAQAEEKQEILPKNN